MVSTILPVRIDGMLRGRNFPNYICQSKLKDFEERIDRVNELVALNTEQYLWFAINEEKTFWHMQCTTSIEAIHLNQD